jgi:hypothetical protein
MDSGSGSETSSNAISEGAASPSGLGSSIEIEADMKVGINS